MSFPVLPANGAGGAYNIESSLRFRSSASTYLNWTPASGGTRTTYTISAWVKRGALDGTNHPILGSYNTTLSYDRFRFNQNDKLAVSSSNGGVTINVVTTQVFRDTSAWYHVMFAVDTTQATASDRIKMYVNGEQITAFDTTTYPAQDSVNTTNFTRVHTIGYDTNGTQDHYFDGYMSEFNFVDGQALTADDFGETNEDTGVWQPIKYTGTYGTNGFYLDGSGVTDGSGNGNDWTNNNLNLSNSALTTYDLMSDTPSLVDEDTSNFATLNPLLVSGGTSVTLSGANLNVSASANHQWRFSTIAVSSGKWYVEYQATALTNTQGLGIRAVSDSTNGTPPYSSSTSYYWQFWDRTYYYAGSNVSYGSTPTTSQTVGMALDLDNGTIEWFVNNTSQGQKTGIPTGVSYYILWTASASQSGSINFGQRPFAYTPPTGYKKLNTYNLPDSDIVDGSQYFNTVLYTGDGDTTSHPITGVGFSPDWIWIKRRDGANANQTYDSVRTLGYVLSTDKTDAEADETSKFVSIDSDGFTIKSNAGSHNLLNATYVAWNWRGSDSTAVSNTVGDVTSTVSANTTSGFSVVTWTSPGGNHTIGHGLGQAPAVVIAKPRNAVNHWAVYHHKNTSAPETEYLLLNQTAGTTDYQLWNDTAPTSSVFTLGTWSANANGNTFVAYCFAEVEGFSKFGSYEGNGSADGPFVYTGFRPAFVMFKNADDSRQWGIVDTSRSTYNQTNATLEPSTSNAENPYDDFDFLSNGFKPRTTDPGSNRSGYTIIYMAFAENPFKNSLAR